MSLFGVLSLCVLVLCVTFIYLHSKFMSLHSEMLKHETKLRDAIEYKIQLLLYLSSEREEEPLFPSLDDLSETLKLIESKTSIELFSKCDQEELNGIDEEIAEANELYYFSEAKFMSFKKTLGGRVITAIIGDITLGGKHLPGFD